MAIWVWIAVQGALTLASALLQARRKQTVEPTAIEVPDTQSGDPIPLVFGTCKIPVRPVDFSAGDWRTEDIRTGPREILGLFGKRAVTGQRYRASFVGLLCHGPATMSDLLVDGKSVAAAGTQQQLGINMATFPPTITYTPVGNGFAATADGAMQFTGKCNVGIYVPLLLGGDDAPNNGGVAGTLVYRDGVGHSTLIPELVARHSDVPTWRTFAHVYFDDVYLGNAPQLPPLHAVVTRTPRTAFSPMGTTVDSTGDANPIAILWELLVDPETGLGLPIAALDAQGFADEALYMESFGGNASLGLSFVVDRATPAKDLIDDVLRTIDAVLTTHPVTGLLTIKPLRRRDVGASVATLPQVSPANARRLQWTPPVPASDYNSVRVAFTDRDRGFQRNTVTATRHDLVAQMGELRELEVEFLGCTRESMARRLADRELRAQTIPLGRGVVEGDRSLAGVMPGEWVCVNWPEHGLTDRVLRVLDVDLGTLDNPVVTLDVVDDIYAFSGIDATVILSEPWEPTVPAATVIAPTTETEVVPGGTGAQVKLLVIDPQARVTATEWRTYPTRGTPGAYAAPSGPGPGYVLDVTLSPIDGTVVEWRITWTDDAAVSQTLTQSLTIPTGVQLAAPLLSVSWTDATTAVVTATPGDSTALAGVRFSSGTAAQTDADVIAGALDASAPYTLTVTVPSGEVRYVGARAEATVSGSDVTSAVARLALSRGGGGAPSGAAGGVLSGTYPNPSFAEDMATQAELAAAVAPLAPLASPGFTGTPTAPTPPAGDNDTSLATTAFVQDAIATALAGGGASLARVTETFTTSSIGAGATATGTVALGRAGILYRVDTDVAAWVRLYSSAAARAADSTRLIINDPTPGKGVLLDLLTSSSLLSIPLAPPADYQNADTVPAATIYYAVVNKTNSPTAITVTITHIPLES